MSTTKTILVTGATGKQGGAVIKALLSSPNSPFTILAVTRDPTSPSSKRLASNNPSVTLVKGDFNDIPSIFSQIDAPLYGVFLMTVPSVGPFAKHDAEEVQGKSFVDAAFDKGVSHFVFTSVDRGGPDKSETAETGIPHFDSKARVERHLIEKIDAQPKGHKTSYTILRTVAFFENLSNDFLGRTFAAMWKQLGSKPMWHIATRDIGVFGALCFQKPEEYRDLRLSIGTEHLTYDDGRKIFRETVGMEMPITYEAVGSLLQWMVPELGRMFGWFKTDGCQIDVEEVKRRNPDQMGFARWLREESQFKGLIKS